MTASCAAAGSTCDAQNGKEEEATKHLEAQHQLFIANEVAFEPLIDASVNIGHGACCMGEFRTRANLLLRTAMINRLSRKTQYDLEIADQCWRTAFLLCRLLDVDERSESGIKLLADAAMNWIHAENVEARIIGLNLLRFLLKAKLVKNSALQREKTLEIFFLNKRSDVRLAALDLLGALGRLPNPVEQIPSSEVAELREFSSRMLEALNASQYSYAAKGFRVDVERCVEGKTAYAAMQEIVQGVRVN